MSLLRHKEMMMILILGSVLFFWNLGVPALRNTEGGWAAITQNMYERGDIFTMEIGREDYYDKPFLSYWLMLLCSKIMGGVSETTVRLPSAISAVLALLLTYLFAQRFFDKSVAILSSFFLATSLGFVTWARHGQVEMLNLCAILLVLWLFFCRPDNTSVRWLYLMTAAMAVTSWLKGPLCYVVPGFVIVLHSLVARDWKWFRPGHIVLAGTISLGLYFVPFVLAWLATGKWDALYMVYRENVVRFVDPFDHVRPFYYYFADLALGMLPWSAFFPWAIVYLARQWKTLPAKTKDLLIIVAGVFIFFALSGSRRSYYLIPILPFTAMCMALFFNGLPALTKAWHKSVAAVWGLVGIACLIPLAARLAISPAFVTSKLTALFPDQPDSAAIVQMLFATPLLVIVTIVCLIGLLLLVLSYKPMQWANIVAFAACGYALMFLYFGVMISQIEMLRGNRVFVQQAAQMIPAKSPIAFFPKEDGTVIFYLQIFRQLKEYHLFRKNEELPAMREFLLKTDGYLITDRKLGEGWDKVLEEKLYSLQSRKRDIWILYRAKP